MRRLVVLIATLLLVPLVAAPASAADNVVTVSGFAYPAGLLKVSRPCGATPFDGNTTQRLYRAGGALGDHATGLGFGGGTTGEAGVQVSLATPSQLTDVSFETLHPAGPAGSSPGHYYVSLDPSGGGFQTFYYANLNLNVALSDWGSWSGLDDYSLDWYFWDGVSASPGPLVVGMTAAQFASTYGDGSGARIGFLFGCDGRDYYMDNLRVGVGSTTTVYDFEGVPSEIYLGSWNWRRKKVQYPPTITLVSRQGHWLAGDGHTDGDAQGYGIVPAGWFAGTASLYAKRYGRSTLLRVGSEPFTVTDTAWFRIRPRTNTIYAMDTPATNAFEGSVSNVLTVLVKRRVRAQVVDRTIYRGQSIKVVGHLQPRTRGIGVSLQRRTSSGWTTIAKGKTRSRGEFSIAATARTAGTWVVRVVAAAGKGNLGNKSSRVGVSVKVPPPKPAPPSQPDPVIVQDPAPPVEDEPGDGPKPGRNDPLERFLRSHWTSATAPPLSPLGWLLDGVWQQDGS